jgi:hypothetical protein
MRRRDMLAGFAVSALSYAESPGSEIAQNTFLELRFWRFHNSGENQLKRVATYLEHGLMPALGRAGARLDGAFSDIIGPDGPYYVTLTQFSSLRAMQETIERLKTDSTHQQALESLSEGPGLPFVRVESSLLRSFNVLPAPVVEQAPSERIFEMRIYESQTFLTLARKVAMFNEGEAQIFERLGMRPVFFGETIAGPRQPNLTYMLSFDNLASRDRLWKEFGSDQEWKKLSTRPGLSDAEIVANISNVILQPLPFSAIR